MVIERRADGDPARALGVYALSRNVYIVRQVEVRALGGKALLNVLGQQSHFITRGDAVVAAGYGVLLALVKLCHGRRALIVDVIGVIGALRFVRGLGNITKLARVVIVDMSRHSTAQTRNARGRSVLLPMAHILILAEGIDPIVKGVEHLEGLVAAYVYGSRERINAVYDLKRDIHLIIAAVGGAGYGGVIAAVVAILYTRVSSGRADYGAELMIIGRVCVVCAVIDIRNIGVARNTAGRLVAVNVELCPAVEHTACLEIADDASRIVVGLYAAAGYAEVFDDRLGAVNIAEQTRGVVALCDYKLVYNKTLTVKDALEAVGLAAADGHPALALIERAVYDDAQVSRQEEGRVFGVVALVYELCEHFELLDVAYAVAYARLRVRLRLIERGHGYACRVDRGLRNIAGEGMSGILAARALNHARGGVEYPSAPLSAAVGRYPCVEKLQKIVASDVADGLFLFGRAHGGA